jgi:hypothetical protein
VENTFSQTVDTKIQEYQSTFKDLKDAFQGRAVLQTEITVSRMLGAVNSLSKQIHPFRNIRLTRFVSSGAKCLQ